MQKERQDLLARVDQKLEDFSSCSKSNGSQALSTADEVDNEQQDRHAWHAVETSLQEAHAKLEEQLQELSSYVRGHVIPGCVQHSLAMAALLGRLEVLEAAVQASGIAELVASPGRSETLKTQVSQLSAAASELDTSAPDINVRRKSLAAELEAAALRPCARAASSAAQPKADPELPAQRQSPITRRISHASASAASPATPAAQPNADPELPAQRQSSITRRISHASASAASSALTPAAQLNADLELAAQRQSPITCRISHASASAASPAASAAARPNADLELPAQRQSPITCRISHASASAASPAASAAARPNADLELPAQRQSPITRRISHATASAASPAATPAAQPNADPELSAQRQSSITRRISHASPPGTRANSLTNAPGGTSWVHGAEPLVSLCGTAARRPAMPSPGACSTVKQRGIKTVARSLSARRVSQGSENQLVLSSRQQAFQAKLAAKFVSSERAGFSSDGASSSGSSDSE
eukprot:TRINITY_DN8170_c1_g1_i1.p1 TRINITY_DN8170_c1_g1~~TRINITY_DN8170_c1_g1_i1.p1  ORF type:complete len:482 (+),score=102.14 TRINITY_DN8170_c1_g1_i1:126-1571(+)